jgi:hypothetical protein
MWNTWEILTTTVEQQEAKGGKMQGKCLCSRFALMLLLPASLRNIVVFHAENQGVLI